MFDKKQLSVVISFFILCFGVIFMSMRTTWRADQYSNKDGKTRQGNAENFFKDILFYKIDQGQPRFSLDSRELTHDSYNKRIFFLEPKGTVLGKEDVEEVYNYTADRGSYNEATGFLRLLGNVYLYDDLSELKAEKVEYTQSTEYLEAHEKVFTVNLNEKTKDKIRVESEHLKSFLGLEKGRYWDNVRGEIKRKRAYEDSVKFKSDVLDSDLLNHYITLEGNVNILKKDVFASGLTGEIFLENYNKKLKYFVLSDDVNLREKVQLDTGEFMERRAFAEKLEGIMGEEKYILTGYPKVIQQKDIIKGNKIILRENNEIVEVDDANSNFILK